MPRYYFDACLETTGFWNSREMLDTMEMTFNDPLALLGPKNLTRKKSWILNSNGSSNTNGDR